MKGNLLIVDDEPATREILARYFTDHDYACDTADGVETAEEKISANDYHVVVTDKNIPVRGAYGEGGLDIIRFVKQYHPAIGTIIMTGFATLESVVESMRMGAFDYIIKPFRMEELRGKVDRALEYRNYLNPDGVMNMYRALQEQLLELIERDDQTMEEKKHTFLHLMNDRLDFMFSTFRNMERMLLYQRENLANTAFFAEQLLDATPESDPRRELVEKLVEVAQKRL